MGFYDPFSKSPNIGGGINDWVSQFMQILMMKKMFPGQEQTQQMGQTPLPTQGSGMPMARPPVPQPPPQMGGMGGGASMGQTPPGQGSLPPELMMLLQKLMSGGMGGI